jgi:hypothetical protein
MTQDRLDFQDHLPQDCPIIVTAVCSSYNWSEYHFGISIDEHLATYRYSRQRLSIRA